VTPEITTSDFFFKLSYYVLLLLVIDTAPASRPRLQRRGAQCVVFAANAVDGRRVEAGPRPLQTAAAASTSLLSSNNTKWQDSK
jgi:hypothetical protein